MRGKAKNRKKSWYPYGITPAHAGKRTAASMPPTWTRDHPRTCGEKATLIAPKNCGSGSPPHMRGKAKTFESLLVAPGITPAHAGKSPLFQYKRCGIGDHPRTCGEKAQKLCVFSPIRGSPPHMRGKEHRTRQAVYKDRITPAHAGKRL